MDSYSNYIIIEKDLNSIKDNSFDEKFSILYYIKSLFYKSKSYDEKLIHDNNIYKMV